jgi:prophage regulatory protein
MYERKSLLRIKRVAEALGIGRSSIYERIAKGYVTPPVRLGVRLVGWPSDEIGRIVDAHIAGYSPDEIAALVRELVAERRSLCPDRRSSQ